MTTKRVQGQQGQYAAAAAAAAVMFACSLATSISFWGEKVQATSPPAAAPAKLGGKPRVAGGGGAEPRLALCAVVTVVAAAVSADIFDQIDQNAIICCIDQLETSHRAKQHQKGKQEQEPEQNHEHEPIPDNYMEVSID